MKTPNLGEAHCGEGALQSQQILFLGSFWRAASYFGQFLSVLCVYGWRRKGLCHPGAGLPLLTLDRVSGSTSHIALEAIVSG